jgi:hypothetical protein
MSPPLLQNLPDSDAQIWVNTNYRECHHWLTQVDRDPNKLYRQLAQAKSTRLGIYFENLWDFYWQHQPHTKLLARNVQLRTKAANENDITRGAFDFLIRIADEFYHIETAVKFYLGVPDGADGPSKWHQWLGPNCNDRLDLKLTRLIQHQLPLSQQPFAQPMLNRLSDGEHKWQRALGLHGYFFYPAKQIMAAPVASNPHHLRGEWWHLQDFIAEGIASSNAGYWLLLPRDRWLSPAQTVDIHELYSGKNFLELVQHWVGAHERPILLAAMQKEDGLWLEQKRCFVVPNHWPWIERPSRNT